MSEPKAGVTSNALTIAKDRETHPERLARMLSELRPLLASFSAPQPASAPSDGRPSSRQLAECLNQLSTVLAHHRRIGTELNAWHMAGIRHDEVRNASVLASLWSPVQLGERAVEFLSAFLARLKSEIPLPSHTELARGYVIQTEHCPTGAATERVDITIEGPDFVLAVEIKIRAGEGKDQLSRYQKGVDGWARARRKRGIVVLLAPFRVNIAGVVHASWNDVYAAIQTILPRKEAPLNHPDRLLADFASHVSSFPGAR